MNDRQPVLCSWAGVLLASATVLQGRSRELIPLSAHRKCWEVTRSPNRAFWGNTIRWRNPTERGQMFEFFPARVT